jgi:phasin
MTTESPEIPSKLRDVAEKSVEQARSAVGTLLDAAHKASEAIQSSTKTGETPEGQAVARGFGFARQNISAIFDFAQKLVHAPSVPDAVKMQSDFVKEQADTMGKQVEELRNLTPQPKP